MTRLDIDPRFAAAHYQDGRDLHGDAQQPSVHSVAGDLQPSSAVRTGDEGWLPPAPIPQDERAAFEQWWKGDEFVNKFYAWSAWQARAQLGGLSVPPEVAGQRPSQDHPESCGSTQPTAVPAYQPMTDEDFRREAHHFGIIRTADCVGFARAIESAVLARVAAAPAAEPKLVATVKRNPATDELEFTPVGDPYIVNGMELYSAAAPAAEREISASPARCPQCRREWFLHATWCRVGMEDAAPAAVQPEPTCRHEPFEGRCIHCDAPFRNGRAAVQPVAQQQPSVHQAVGSGLPSQAVRTGEEGAAE